MAFETTITARFYEIDRAGIVFFGRFFEYAHTAFEDLALAAFGTWEHAFANSSWLMPVVHSEADYLAPTRMGDRLTVEVIFERRGRSSMTFAYRIRCGDEMRATVRLTHASVDRENFKPMEITQEFLRGLEQAGLDIPQPSVK